MPQTNIVNASIVALSTAVPKYKLSQKQAAIEVAVACGSTPKQASIVGHLFKRTGINYRCSSVFASHFPGTQSSTFFYSHDPEKPRGPSTAERMSRYKSDSLLLAIEAAENAFAQTTFLPQDITHLVTVSCTGFAAPGFDLGLINHLNMNADVHRTHVGFMGCHGAMNGLRVAKAFVDADPSNVVLLCATELCSLHFQYDWEPNSIVANSLFADGAAAAILAADNNEELCHLVANGSHIVDKTENAITWEIGDHGFLMKLDTELPNIVYENLPGWLSGWLRKHDLTIADIESWAIHPGGKRVLDAVEATLNLDAQAMQPSRTVLSEFGNMSSPTVLFILRHLLDRTIKLPCIMMAFGPGLTIEAALLR